MAFKNSRRYLMNGVKITDRHKREIGDLLNDVPEETKKQAFRKINYFKLLQIFKKDFCNKCKRKAFNDPRRPITDYCDHCTNLLRSTVKDD